MDKKKMSFKGKVAADSKRQAASKGNYGYLTLPSGVGIFNPKLDVRSLFDVIPYQVTDPRHMDRNPEMGVAVPGEYWFKRPIRTHRNIGANKDSVICLTTIGKKCPICEYRAKLLKEGGDVDVIKALKPSLRNIYAVVPIDNKDYEQKIYIFDISQACFQDKVTKETDEKPEYEEFPNPFNGFTLNVRFDGKTIGSGKPFADASRVDFEKRKKQYDESFLDKVPNLDKIFKVLSYEELEKLFLEIDDEEDGGEIHSKAKGKEVEEEEEEEQAPRSKKTTKHEPEPEEEEEEPEEEEEEEEVSLEDQLNAAKTVTALLEIAYANTEVFKPHMKDLKKIVKSKALRDAMLDIITPEEEEEEEEEPEEEDMPLGEQLENAKTIAELLQIAKANPDIFKNYMKELKEFVKSKMLRERMFAIMEEDLPFNEEEEKPQDKKQEEEEEEENEESLTWDDLKGLSYSLLKNLIKSQGLKIKAADYDDDPEALRKAIAKELSIEVPSKKKGEPKINCVACQDTGFNSKGKPCPICNKEKEVARKDVESPKMTRAPKGNTEERCPSGAVFGKDTDTLKACNSCQIWDLCLDAKEAK